MTDPKGSPSPGGNWFQPIPKGAVLISVGYCLLGFTLIGVLAISELIDRTVIWKLVVAHCVLLGVVGGVSFKLFTPKANEPGGKSNEP